MWDFFFKGAKMRRYPICAMLIIVSFFYSIAYAEVSPEVREIQRMIAEKGLSWTAGQTSMMDLSLEERHQRLGVVIPEEVLARFAQLVSLPPPCTLEYTGIFRLAPFGWSHSC